MVKQSRKLKVIDQQTQMQFGVHKRQWAACTRCEIGEKAIHHVFARGTLPCDVLFIGEAPGNDEDLLGYPFVGKSGRLLDTWLSLLPEMGLTFAITNMVCCKPIDTEGDIRQPTKIEMMQCDTRLRELCAMANPRMLVVLGRVAAKNLPNVLPEIPRLNLLHPAAILRCGGEGSISDGVERKKLKTFLERYA